jgi:hypothetical protein
VSAAVDHVLARGRLTLPVVHEVEEPAPITIVPIAFQVDPTYAAEALETMNPLSSPE